MSFPSRLSAAVAAALLLAPPLGARAQTAAPPAASPARPPIPAGARSTPPRAGVVADTLPLSLADAVDRALRIGDEVQLADAQLDATEAQIVTARSTALPQLRLQGGYTQVLENARASIVGSLFAQNYNYTSGLNLTVPVFQGGRAVAAIQGARAARAAGRETLAESRAQATVDAQRAYLNALGAEELVGIQERNVQLASERLVQTEQLVQAGRAARFDLLRARVERQNLQPLLIQARADRDLAYLELKRLLNVPMAQPVRLTSVVRTDSTSVRTVLARAGADPAGANAALAASRGDAGAAETRAGSDRPAVRGAEATVEARAAAVRAARADWLPTVNFTANLGYLALPSRQLFPTARGQTLIEPTACRFVPISPSDVCTRSVYNNGWYPDRNIGVQLAWPLFDGLRAKGNRELALAQQRTAEVQLAQTREQVTLEAARARTGVARAAALWDAARSTTAEAEEAFNLATLRFQRGLGTQLEVSDAQLALLTARTNALRATLDVYLAAAELARALGRPIPLPE